MKRRTTPEFIQLAKAKHGDRYDYSLVNYVDATQKVAIKCKEHGVFWQNAHSHLQGVNCPKCANNFKGDTKSFIQKAKSIHGDKYDYSLVNYINWKTHVDIVCPIHGVFKQSPLNHSQGQGCPCCGRIKNYVTITKTLEEFLSQAKSIHGNKYDYSLVTYVNTETKVAIICPEHGVFLKYPKYHIRGSGCVKCIGLAKKTLKEFIDQSKLVHGNKYDYSLAEYKSNRDKLLIVCPIHGEFWQSPSNHVKGIGCPSCASHGFNPDLPAVLYLLLFQKSIDVFWKIGITNRTIEERFGVDFRFVVERYEWYFEKGSNALDVEQQTLRKFKCYKAKKLLFDRLSLGGETECFDLSMPVNKVIQHITKQAGYN